MKTIVTETTPLNAHGVDTVSQKIRESLTAYPFLKRRDILRIQLSAEEFMLHWMAEVKDAEIQLSIEQKGRWLNISLVLIGPGYRCDPLSGESALGGLAAVTASQFVLVVLRLKIPVAKLWTILKPSFMVQLASASSSVAFAESYEACERGFGIDRKLVRFALPIGTVMHKPLIAAEFIFIIAAARGADGVVMNVRDAAPLCAGLLFGGPAGLIAGTIGGIYRWLCVCWGGGMVTRAACSLAAFLAGVFSGLMRRTLFDENRPGVLSAFGIGATMEVLHMLLVLATNLGDVYHAFSFVQQCSFTMILCNGIALMLSTIVCAASGQRKHIDIKSRRISYDFGFWLLVCVVIAFFITGSFTQQIIYRITTDDAALYRNVTLYLVAFMEVLIYTALFILIYQMLKKKVICNLERVNDGLKAIAAGDLDTVINVRAYKEFAELSDDVNATVSSLKHYIHAAEERIDQELEVARQIQNAALPRVFPARPDFDLFASMHAAKEIGGDFYDFYLLDRYTLVFLIADVSGKGIPAAMFMMRAKTLLKDLAESGRNVDEVFTRANAKLCAGNDTDMFLISWMGKLDMRTGELDYVNAGHNPPLLRRRDGQFEYLRTKPNFVLAGTEKTRYCLHTLKLCPGDALYLYTDGVTEAANGQNDLFGEARLKDFLSAAENGTDVQDICSGVSAALHGFVGDMPQSDDITMLCVRINAMQDKAVTTMVPDENSYAIVQAFLADRLETANTPQKTLRRMQVVTDEIWSNIVHYSGAALASLSLSREGDTLYLNFRDNGKPYDPTAAAAPDITLPAEERPIGGLGLHMVRKMSTSMQYRYSEGENRLSVGFELEKQP